MPPKRFFVDRISEEVVLEGDEFNHAKNVLRLGAGDEITLLDGSGKEYTAIVSKCEKHAFLCHVTGESISDREPKSEICLLLGALKGDKTELAVQKATELGIARICIFTSRYVSAFMNDNKLGRLQRVALEAAKQCLRARAPEVEYFETLEGALTAVKDYKTKLFFCEFAKQSDFDFSEAESPLALVVGSEGGFCEEEFALAKRLGFSGMTLGKRILRAETAAISVVAVAAYILGELK